MKPEAPSRLTIVLAIAAIIAAIGMLVAGVLFAPSGDEEPPASSGASPAHGDTDRELDEVAASAAPHTDGGGGADSAVPIADSPSGTAAHGHEATVAPAPVAVATSDGHGDSGVAHVADHAHDVANPAPTDPAAVTTTTTHDHGTPVSTTVPVGTTTSTPTGPVITLDDPRLTAAQRDAAQTLLDRTHTAMARFPDEAAVLAAGYVSIGDGITGFEHFVHVGHLADGAVLDPDRIESIVLRVSGGTKTVESAMYILEPGSTMEDVPDIAGELTTWHDHQNLCWEGIRVVAVTRDDGSCPRGEFRPTPPMLHVWLREQPCGPFAGIEGTHGDACSAHH